MDDNYDHDFYGTVTVKVRPGDTCISIAGRRYTFHNQTQAGYNYRCSKYRPTKKRPTKCHATALIFRDPHDHPVRDESDVELTGPHTSDVAHVVLRNLPTVDATQNSFQRLHPRNPSQSTSSDGSRPQPRPVESADTRECRVETSICPTSPPVDVHSPDERIEPDYAFEPDPESEDGLDTSTDLVNGGKRSADPSLRFSRRLRARTTIQLQHSSEDRPSSQELAEPSNVVSMLQQIGQEPPPCQPRIDIPSTEDRRLRVRAHLATGGAQEEGTRAASRTIHVRELMENTIDSYAIQFLNTATPVDIWNMIYEDFYSGHTHIIKGGLKRGEAIARVNRARAQHYGGADPVARVEREPICFVLNTEQLFFQFNQSFYVGTRLHRVVGWAHPALLALLLYKGLHLFIDGTFRCVPSGFYQCIVIMAFDPATSMYIPVFHILATGKDTRVYTQVLQNVKDSVEAVQGHGVGGMEPGVVTCDFELALISTVKRKFPGAKLIGCFFHWKQALRRWLQKEKMDETEVRIAMRTNFLDTLTVVRRTKMRDGIKFVKRVIAAACKKQGVAYSTATWDKFWAYFSTTWLSTYKPELWNVRDEEPDLVNRTNNALESYNRTLNEMFTSPHPKLSTFVTKIEAGAREYVRRRSEILQDQSLRTLRAPIKLPRIPPKL